MKFIKELFQNPIVTFALGAAIAGGSILILFAQKSEDNYYLAKSNLALAQTLQLNQRLLVIQDSILRLDNQIFKTNNEPSQELLLMDERFELMDYYIRTAKELQLLLVGYDQNIDKRLQDHYYSKYKSFFEGKQWDKDQLFIGREEGEPIIQK